MDDTPQAVQDAAHRLTSSVKRPELSAEALVRTRMKMCAAFPDAMVAVEAMVPPVLGLPDPDDVHVIESAIRADAASIVTFNLHHFPERVLDPRSHRQR